MRKRRNGKLYFHNTRLVGLRTIKTAVAVCLVVIIYLLLGSRDPTLACIAALLCMQDSVKKTIAQGVQRIGGTLIGGAAGFLFALFPLENGYLSAVVVMLFTVGVIVACNLSQRPDYIAMACITFLSIAFSSSGESPLMISLENTVSSLIGIVVAVVVNRLLFDPQKYAERPYEDGMVVHTGGAYYVIIANTRVLLVNKEYSVLRSFADGINPCAETALEIMFEAAKQAGVSLFVVSSFREYSYQKKLYSSAVKAHGARHAEQYNARAGHSEHETGLAFDLNGLDKTTILSESFCETPEYAWLKQNAATFGFIERYSRGKAAITGYAFEPWHYRYVGVAAARELEHSGKALEEYIAQQ